MPFTLKLFCFLNFLQIIYNFRQFRHFRLVSFVPSINTEKQFRFVSFVDNRKPL